MLRQLLLPKTKSRSPTIGCPLANGAFLPTGWLIVLMPFLFWWNTWFGGTFLRQNWPNICRMKRTRVTSSTRWCRSASAWPARPQCQRSWYPEVVRLAAYPVEEVRNTDAWVMGQDNSAARGIPRSASENVERSFTHGARQRGIVAGAVRRCFGTSQIVALLQPAKSQRDPGRNGHWMRAAGDHNPSGRIDCQDFKIGAQTFEVRSPITDAYALYPRQWVRPFLPARRLQSSILGRSKSGKPCVRLYLIGQLTTCRRYLRISANCRKFPTTFANRRRRPKRQFDRGRSNSKRGEGGGT